MSRVAGEARTDKFLHLPHLAHVSQSKLGHQTAALSSDPIPSTLWTIDLIPLGKGWAQPVETTQKQSNLDKPLDRFFQFS